MKLAVLSDIHGNRAALEAVLADLEVVAPDSVVVNGDLVNRGPENAAVMELVAAGAYPLTLGNHDDLVLMWHERDPRLPDSVWDDPLWADTAWCSRQLAGGGWLELFRDLPLARRLAADGAPSVLVSHGSPRNYREGYGRFTSDDALAEIAADYPAGVLVGSHTHRPFERELGGTTFLNTGAVGAPFNGDPRAQYLVLHLEDGAWRPEFRRVPYDRAAALAAFSELGYLQEGGLSALIYYEELRTARSHKIPFLRWAREAGLEPDADAWERFREALPERFEPPEERFSPPAGETG